MTSNSDRLQDTLNQIFASQERSNSLIDNARQKIERTEKVSRMTDQKISQIHKGLNT